LLDPPKLSSRWGAPGDDVDNAASFSGARSKQGPLKLPWSEEDPKHQHFFWQFYLENTNPFKITAGQALRRLVPVRQSSLARVSSPALPGRFSVEAYHYPHGLGLVLGVRIKVDLPLFEMVEKALDLARTETLDVVWEDKAAEQLTVSQFGSAALDRLRAATFGEAAAQGIRSAKPFSIATIVQGVVPPGTEPAPKDNPDLHRALDALASWNPNWKTTDPSPLAERSLGLRKGPAKHTLYGLTSGRAVWFPDSFGDKAENEKGGRSRKPSLSCYHRNLIFTSLQTESLARLMDGAKRTWLNGEKLSPAMQRLVKFAAGILGRMYGGDKSVYCSFSPAMQLEDNGWIPVLQEVRKEVGMLDALTRERPKTAPQP
jgi:hypothetical protein